MRRKPEPQKPDRRQPWQITQGNACGCRGVDDYCPCQNVDRTPPMTDHLPERLRDQRQQEGETATMIMVRWAAEREEAAARIERLTVERDEAVSAREDIEEGWSAALRRFEGAEQRVTEAASLIQRLEGERDEARNAVVKCKDLVLGVADRIEDEGDRTYFGSTNDPAMLRALGQELDALHWQIFRSSALQTGGKEHG